MKHILVGAAIVVVAGILVWHTKPCATFNEAVLQTPLQTLSIALATTPEKQARGLGGCKAISNNAGMYFPFTEAQERTFWMKDMLIPIDIIWIKEGIVVGMERNVPNLPLNTLDSELPRYTSPGAVDAVLEVGGGKAGQYGIQEGSALKY